MVMMMTWQSWSETCPGLHRRERQERRMREQLETPQLPGRPILYGWASVLILSSVLLLLGWPVPVLAQCSATSVAITGITTVTIDSNTDTADLVADCNTLLNDIKDGLSGTATLDWAAGTSMDMWDGVTVAGTTPRVTELRLSNKSLTGTIPDLSTLTELKHLDISNNALTGDIPDLSDLIQLTWLDLKLNKLTGIGIDSLLNLDQLTLLYLDRNELTGDIPI